jgi:hypothetical protein
VLQTPSSIVQYSLGRHALLDRQAFVGPGAGVSIGALHVPKQLPGMDLVQAVGRQRLGAQHVSRWPSVVTVQASASPEHMSAGRPAAPAPAIGSGHLGCDKASVRARDSSASGDRVCALQAASISNSAS